MNSENYQTVSGDCIPEAVTDTFDPANEWVGLDPMNVTAYRDYDGKLYQGIVDGKRQYVTEHGWPSPESHHDYVEHVGEDRPIPDFAGAYTYGDRPDVVHHDHYAEHVTKVIVVTRRGRFVLNSRSGVLWWDHTSDRDPNDEVRRIAAALSDHSHCGGEPSFDTPEDFASALDGWHSSMERSEQSEKMNALAGGDYPDHFADYDNVFPYVVKYGDTRNVCSVNASVYGYPRFRELVREEFDGASARPAGAGFS